MEPPTLDEATENFAATARFVRAHWGSMTPRARDAVRGVSPVLASSLDELFRRGEQVARARTLAGR